MERVALLTAMVWACSVIPAVADEPLSIFERWQTLEIAAREEFKKYPPPPHLFADGEAYRQFVKESDARASVYREQLLAKFKGLLAEGKARQGEASFDDHLALAVMSAGLQQNDDALQHAEAADQAKPDDPRVLLVLMIAQLRNNGVDAAAKTLARVVDSAPLPDVNWTHSFLHLAHNLFRQAKRWEAVSRSGRWLLDFKRACKPQSALDCLGSVIILDLAASAAARDGWGELALDDLNREERAWEVLAHPYTPWVTQRLFARRILLTAGLGKKNEAGVMLNSALADARQRRNKSPDDVNACLRIITLERAQLELLPPDEKPPARNRFAESLHVAIRQFPVDAMAIEFGQGADIHIFDLIREGEYEAATAAKDAVLETLRGLPSDFQLSRALVFVYRMAYLPNEDIERGLRRNQLVGKAAPPLEAAAWLNGSPLVADDLRGKVVLLDFWAVWCGPCVRAFPDLIEWHTQYADKGLVMIGVTKYYGIGWDSKNSRTTRPGNLSNAEEQVALEDFAKHHELPYHLALDAENDKLSNRFGVEGIPQIVLVDRKGIVRLVRVGTSAANSREIAKTIETLLAE